MYVGSCHNVTDEIWIWDKATKEMIFKEITYTPAFLKIYDEILVNCADHRIHGMNTIRIDINKDTNEISIWNNGERIPIVMHKNEKMWIPKFIFSQLLVSSNFDKKKSMVGGQFGYGAKLCNIFSKKFTIETARTKERKKYVQTWLNNMGTENKENITKYNKGRDYTKITFIPDLARMSLDKIDDDTIGLLSRRAYDVAASVQGIKVISNGEEISVKKFEEYVKLFLKGPGKETNDQVPCIYEKSSERWGIPVAPSKTGFQTISFVNNMATT